MRANRATRPASALPLTVSLLVLFFSYWCVDIVTPTLPTITEALNLSATGAGLVFSVFFGGRLLTNLPAAWLVDRRGPRLTAGIGAAILLAGSVLAALAQSEVTLLPARGVQGAGVALLATAGLLSVLRALPAGGAAMTAFNVASGVGGSVGLLLGGFLTSNVGWRAVFWISAAAAGVLLVLALGSRTQRGQARVPAAETEDEIPRRATSAMWAAVAANFLVFVNYATWVVTIPLYAASRFGLGATEVALVLLFVNLVHLGAAVPFGQAIRRFGAPAALAVGLGLAGAGMLLAPLATTPVMFAAPLGLYAIGQLAGNSAAGDLVLRLGGGGGRAVGAVRLSSDVGMVIGPAAAGALADAAGAGTSFTALGLLSLVGMVIALLARQQQRAARRRQQPR
ncbi:MAG: MFS transporter [Thermomicrobiales bacterium]